MITPWYTNQGNGGTGFFHGTTHRVEEGTPQPTTVLGASQERIRANVAMGTVSIDTLELSFPAPGLPNNLHRIYRSQDQGWYVGPVSKVRPFTDRIDYLHADGDVSHFVAIGENIHECFWPEVGRVTLTKENNKWILSIPATGVTETFNADTWLLERRTSWDGGDLSYEYVPNSSQLLSVTDSAGGKLSLEHSELETIAYYQRPGEDKKEYARYIYHYPISWDANDPTAVYDQKSRLISTTDRAGRKLKFEHREFETILHYQRTGQQGEEYARLVLDQPFTSNQTNIKRLVTCKRRLEDGQEYRIDFDYTRLYSLTSLTQSDGTRLDVDYEDNGPKVKFLGHGNSLWKLDYEPGVTTVTAPEGESTKWHFNDKKRITRHETYDKAKNKKYATSYDKYDEHDYLEQYTEQDGTTHIHKHDSQNGWRLTTRVVPIDSTQKERTETLERTATGQIAKRTLQQGTESSTTKNIHAKEPSQQLRFVMDLTGQVFEFRYNDRNQLEFAFTHFTDPYLDDNPTLEKLEAWASQVPPSQIQVEKFAYHPNGSISHREIYSADNPDNKQVWDYEVNEFGLVTKETEPSSAEKRPETTYKYDLIKRLLSTTKADGRITSHQYEGAKKTTTTPRGATDVKTQTASGKIDNETLSAPDLIVVGPRTAAFTYSADIVVKTKTDELGRVTTTLFDELGRACGVIDAAGFVSLNHLDHRGRTTCTEKPSSPLLLTPSQRANLNAKTLNVHLVNLRAHETPNRSWIVYDAQDRPLYAIDPTGAVTEYRYGLGPKPELTIKYATRIDINNLSTAPSSAEIASRIKEHTDDRKQRDWYDGAGQHLAQLIQQTAEEAFLTEWIYHHQGEMVVQRDYVTAVKSENKWTDPLDSLRQKSDDDVLTSRYYNQQKKEIAVIKDVAKGEGILTEYTRDVRGDIVHIRRYYHHVAHSETPHPLASVRPQTHSEDWHTEQKFDDLHRIKERHHPNGRIERLAYDNSQTATEHKDEDAENKHARGEAHHLNSLEEPVKTLLPSGLDYLYQHPDDKEKAWEIYARTLTRDKAGRVAVQTVRLYTDPERTDVHRVVDFYDARNNIRFHIGAVGEITEYLYDSRNNRISERHYLNTLTESECAKLQGGELTEAEQAQLEAKRDPKDRITTSVYDAADHKIQENRPNGQKVLYTYNAFGKCQALAEQLESEQGTDLWRVTFITFNAMGQEVKREEESVTGALEAVQNYLNTHVPDAISVKEQRVVHRMQPNRFGMPLKEWDGNGVETQNTFDKAQRLTQKSCQNKILDNRKYDAHDRTKERHDDREGAVSYDYDTPKRSVTQTYYEGYDDEGKPSKPLPYSHTKTMDAFDNVTEERRENSFTETDWNAYDRANTETDPLGNITLHQYAVAGELESSQDAMGREVFLHDAAYRTRGHYYEPAESVDSDAWQKEKALNAFGDITLESTTISEVDTAGFAVRENTIKRDYDSASRPRMSTQDPDGMSRHLSTSRRLDGAPKQQTISSPKGTALTIDVEHDGFGRKRKTVKDPAGKKLTSVNAYDAGEQPIAITDANGETTHFIYAGHGLSTLTITHDGRATFTEQNQAGNTLRVRQ